jgi:RNA polymerase sigma factor (sigma-70 family)
LLAPAAHAPSAPAGAGARPSAARARAIVVRAAAALGASAPLSRGPARPLPLEAARRGDGDALERVAEHVLRVALRTAGGVLRGRDEAADIAQDVAIEVIRDLAQLRDLDRFDAWVHRITVRRTLRVLKRGKARREAETPLDVLGDAGVPPDPDDPFEALAAGTAVRAALADLPARQQLAVVLRYGHDLTEREVADALGCRPGSAAAMLSRARTALKSSPALEAYGVDE